MYTKTARLDIKPFSDEDIPALMELLLDGEIKRTYMLPDFESEEQCRHLAARLGALSLDQSRCVAGIYLDNLLIGFLNDVEITGGRIELGYVIGPKHWGRGYATEALAGVMDCLFENGFREVVAGAFADNAASIRVMEKAGMAKLEQEDQIEYRGVLYRCVYYSKENPRK